MMKGRKGQRGLQELNVIKAKNYIREKNAQWRILPNFVLFIFLIFAFKFGHFKVQTIYSYATNTQA
jgi:hypothetical protein